MNHESGNKKFERSVVASARKDVTGDKIPDNVFLTGDIYPGSHFLQNITLVVKDGRTGRITRVLLKENAGYNPTLFLGSFTDNGVNDILIRIDSGGSGAFTFDYIYSFVNNIPKLLFDSDKYNDTYRYTVSFKDYYTVEVKSLANKTNYLINIVYKGISYLNEIYDKNGKLKEPIEGFVNPLSALYPVDVDSNGIYELLAFQKIAGRYNADGLGYIQNFLMYKNGEFILFDQYLGINGARE